MSPYPAAPDPSSPALKTRVANFMRRADDILRHPLADVNPGISITFTVDPTTNAATATAFDLQNVSVEALVYLATKMRPIIYLQDDPISLKKLIASIEREHAGLRGRFAPLRDGFNRWLNTPIVETYTLGEVPPELQTDQPQILRVASAPVGTPLSEGVELTDMVSDMYYAKLYFNGEHWHSDDEKAAEYEAASDYRRAFIAKCAELRTLGAIPFIRSLHTWVTEVRAKGMDI